MKWLVAAALAIGSAGSAQAGTIIFHYTPDRSYISSPYHPGMFFDGPIVTFEGILSGAHEGDNFSFDLFATVTAAGDTGLLGGGYKLIQRLGTSPSLTVKNGVVTFANAAMRRSPTEAFQLSTPGGSYITGAQYSPSNGFSYIDMLDDNKGLSFGKLNETTVPEPATWLTMLVGFAMIGFALRRSRRPITHVTAG